MSKKKRQLILSTFVQQYGTHANAWRRSETKAGGNPDFNEWANTVRLLERGKFDIAFFADFVGNSGDNIDRIGRHPRGGGFEPLTLTAALSQVTRHIGLVATVNTNFNEPYNVARRFASLDHLTGGRIGWNVVSSLSDGAAKSFGVDSPLDHAGRYERAAEFIEVAKSLWDTWDDGAFDHPNKETGEFLDSDSVHPIHHHGKHFGVDTLLDIARPIQGYPVFFQAGNSETGREFAARHAELIYAAAQTIEEAKAYYDDVKGRLAKFGREQDDLRVIPGLFYHIGSSRQEAEEKYQSYRDSYDLDGRRQLFGIDLSQYPLDGPLPENLPEPVNGVGRWRQAVALARRENLSIRELILRFSIVQGHRIVVGTPVDIADQIEDWFVNGAADGFNLKPSFLPDSLEDFVNLVVPELQKRGIFRTEYEGRTLRENLGFKRPPNQHLQRKAAKAA
ncbi:LLM class flavin-dependent oxidoreductase [Candidatus Methylospira mobilis]|uniref:LLM class flavin-dependent oxidoreductase n=1 Tax=Candidatus Methylospira mobilis TaxID=1808979 RepID=A0A5Q0BKJ3_9GAMM|nr:LLM class flavin-dependent oxidoreductase [Candidatus Methylospira mobilis]QFY42741.1 LLM class flavin-dependent oxidoreductase [Candidatus Methylospira mobilis]